MYVATVLLSESKIVVRLDVVDAGLLGTVAALVTTTNAEGVTRERRLPLLPEAVTDLGAATAALVEAFRALAFSGESTEGGEVMLVHAAADLPPEAMGQVLHAGTVAHAIQSLATSASLQ